MTIRPLLLACCLGCGLPAQAAVFCATNATQLRDALDTAADNGEADEIRLSRTTFTGSSMAPFKLVLDEPHGLKISGGWSVLGGVACIGQVFDATRTVLDGGASSTALEILVIEQHAIIPIAVEGLTLRNGHSSTGFAAGLAIVGTALTAPSIAVDRVVVHSNVGAAQHVPAVSLSSDHHFVRFSNSIVRGNTTSDAPAISTLSNAGGVAIHNLTVIDNDDQGANGGTVQVLGVSGAQVHNSVFWNNAGGDLYADGHVRYHDNRFGTGDPVLFNLQGFNNHQIADPRLQSSTTPRPLSDSPLRNNGGTPVAQRDAFGGQRVMGGQADIGALEFIE